MTTKASGRPGLKRVSFEGWPSGCRADQVDLGRAMRFGRTAQCDETDRPVRHGRGSNGSAGGLLHRRRNKVDYNLQAPGKGGRFRQR